MGFSYFPPSAGLATYGVIRGFSGIAGAGSGGGNFPTWTRKAPLVIQHGQVTADQVAFPVLITAANLPAEMVTLSGANAAQSDGGDIRFSTDSAGVNQLACEVVVWTQNAVPANAVAEIWVPVNVLAASDVIIYVWYAKTGAISQPGGATTFGSRAVWDANYKDILHFGDGTTLSVADSTANATVNTNHSGAAVAGKFGGGISFAATTNYVQVAGAPSGHAARTVEGWVKTSDTGTKVLYDQGAAATSVRFLLYNSGTNFITVETGGDSFNGTTNIRDGAWHHFAATSDGLNVPTSYRLYVDGVPQGTSNITFTQNTQASPQFLNSNVDGNNVGEIGSYDEFRISIINRSATWIATEYNNQNSPATFIIAGAAGPA